MSTNFLPPAPIRDPWGAHVWVEWFKNLRDFIMPKVEVISPATGFSATIANSTKYLISTTATTLATGTIIMPAKPMDGQVVTIATRGIITTLTHSPNTGQSLRSPLVTTTVDLSAAWIYNASTSTWYRLY